VDQDASKNDEAEPDREPEGRMVSESEPDMVEAPEPEADDDVVMPEIDL
jgi:hypothetical protein